VRSTIPARRSEESQRAPPPPPRRSKSYERPQQDPDEGGFSNYFEEYDLAHMDVDSSTIKGKRVSFEGEQTATSLKKLPSVPILSQVRYVLKAISHLLRRLKYNHKQCAYHFAG